jgi:hypothetical protein
VICMRIEAHNKFVNLSDPFNLSDLICFLYWIEKLSDWI